MPRKTKAAPTANRKAAPEDQRTEIVADAEDAGKQAAPRLTGDRNRCPPCGEYFNSTSAFDKHRTGRIGIGRRCMTTDEMLRVGMTKNAAGFWIEKAHSTASVQRIAGFPGSDVCEYPPEEKAPEIALGRCQCGTPIGSRITGLHCPTCSAWRRWFSAHRIASHAAEITR
jgi:hypothetical protein